MTKSTANLFKENQEKLIHYRDVGFSEVALLNLNKIDANLAKEFPRSMTITKAQEITEDVSNAGLSFIAIK